MREIRKFYRSLWVGTFVLILGIWGPLSWAEGPPKPPDPEKMQAEMQKMQKQMQEQQEKERERLKQINPQLYEQTKKADERQRKITAILTAYQQKSISGEEAERRLSSLIREEIQMEGVNLDQEIKNLEKKLAFLKKAKNNPDLLVKKRVDQLLGKSGPDTNTPF